MMEDVNEMFQPKMEFVPFWLIVIIMKIYAQLTVVKQGLNPLFRLMIWK